MFALHHAKCQSELTLLMVDHRNSCQRRVHAPRELDLECRHAPLQNCRGCWLAAKGMFTTDLAKMSKTVCLDLRPFPRVQMKRSSIWPGCAENPKNSSWQEDFGAMVILSGLTEYTGTGSTAATSSYIIT